MKIHIQKLLSSLESFRRTDVIPEPERHIRSGSEGQARTELFRRRSGEMEVQQWDEQHAKSDTIGKTSLLG